MSSPAYRIPWRPVDRSLLGTLSNSSLAECPPRLRGRRETAFRCQDSFGALHGTGMDVEAGRPDRFLLSAVPLAPN
jgi:hypothetical protein